MIWNVEEFVNQSMSGSARAKPSGKQAGTSHVAILMALHNGARNLDAQLSSLDEQIHDDWSLIVSDDNSTDDGPERIRRHAAGSEHPIALIKGPNLGFAQNFLHLIAAAGPNVPYCALSDQDDVWLPGKLSQALDQLASLPEGKPALYAGRTIICDAKLKPLRPSPLFALPPSFENALVQSIGGGNTMVLNRAALDLAQETARHASGVAAHDWWLYQIISGAGGHVIYDPRPMVLYRQHGGNLIGANDTILASAVRLCQVLRGRFRTWNTANAQALHAASHWLTPDARRTLDEFHRARGGTARSRLNAVRNAGLYRQTRRGNIALALAAMIDRI
jgi:glycosyltransferase involved in cell wall biosynthesis